MSFERKILYHNSDILSERQLAYWTLLYYGYMRFGCEIPENARQRRFFSYRYRRARGENRKKSAGKRLHSY